MIIYEGDYARLGATILDKKVTFTFAGEKEDKCYVVLVDANGEETKVLVDEKYCLGSLRSIAISEIGDIKFYYYEINGEKVLDPYATAIGGREVWNDASRKEKNYDVTGVLRTLSFDWGEDLHPEVSKRDMIIYKLHVRGFSKDRGTNGKIAGTFAAIIEKLDYLQSLGVTTLELMPCYEFEEMIVPKKEPVPDYITWKEEAEDLIVKETVEAPVKLNYWGYGEGNYFAVKSSYATKPERANEEFMTLVKELHNRGMELVMEMYFDEKVNHNLILSSLRYWVRIFHVDGFHLLGENLPIKAIAQDALLSRTKLFYTGFDYGLEEQRSFQNLYVYKEEYQYPVRKILNHINGDMIEFTNQQKKQGNRIGFVNYISSNNGFSMADLFMYNDRHNEDNGENNEDGNPWNFSSNYGVEGPTRKKFVTMSRNRQWRNAILCLFLAQGVPMLWSGDEMQNSQKGNNNAYCQDNPIGWLNWKNAKSNSDCIDFVKAVISFRKAHPILAKEEPFHFNDYKTVGLPDLSYHGENAWISGVDLGRMSIGMLYAGSYDDTCKDDIYIGYNFFSSVANLALPKLPKKKKWYLVIDSNRDEDPVLLEEILVKNQNSLQMGPQSICVLVGK